MLRYVCQTAMSYFFNNLLIHYSLLQLNYGNYVIKERRKECKIGYKTTSFVILSLSTENRLK